MSVIPLPQCGQMVNGRPCMRVPGHLGECINDLGDIQYEAPALPPLDLPDFGAWITRIIVWSVVLWILVLFSTGVSIYMLVRLPCHRLA